VEALLRSTQVQGFRSALRAPIPRQAAALEPLLTRSGHLTRAVLAAWLAGQPKLLDAVRRFLLVQGTSVLALEDLPAYLMRTWGEGELEELQSRFSVDNPAFEAARRGGCPLHDLFRAPSAFTRAEEEEDQLFGPLQAQDSLVEQPETDESQETTAENAETADVVAEIADLLSAMDKVDLTESEWGALSSVLTQLQEKIAAKIAAQRDERGKLTDALAAFHNTNADHVRFFGYLVDGWLPDSVPLARVGEVIEDLGSFSRLLQQHAEARQRQASSLADDRSRRVELTRVEGELDAVFSRLAVSFGPRSGQQESPSGPAVPSAPEEPGEQPQKTPAEQVPAEANETSSQTGRTLGSKRRALRFHPVRSRKPEGWWASPDCR